MKEKSMQAIEFETKIDNKGNIYLPEEFQYAYGRFVRLVVLLPEQTEAAPKKRQPGSAKGILHVLSEDDDHLDDFKEYMP
ncbi:MAG: DUF2281 domain-containing protein [Desulfobacterales bacterium]|nr:DUF2281 domain-containing protein [Desulfobacterales bacterium]